MSAMRLWGVRALDADAVRVVLATNSLVARMRVSDERSIPLRRLVAEPEIQPFPKTAFRCGAVRVDVVWSTRDRSWFACTTHAGTRRYVEVESPPPTNAGGGREASRKAARLVVAVLIERDEVEHSALLWESDDVLHMVEERARGIEDSPLR